MATMLRLSRICVPPRGIFNKSDRINRFSEFQRLQQGRRPRQRTFSLVEVKSAIAPTCIFNPTLSGRSHGPYPKLSEIISGCISILPSRYILRASNVNISSSSPTLQITSSFVTSGEQPKKYDANDDELNDCITATDGLRENEGGRCYDRAMEALQKAAQMEELHEQRLMKEQYEAMDRQKNRENQRKAKRQKALSQDQLRRLQTIESKDDGRDRAAGVAVIRTIVKQSQRKESIDNIGNVVQVEQWKTDNAKNDLNSSKPTDPNTDGNENDAHFWRDIARQHMEEAAFRFGHPLALVRLGNEALESAKGLSPSKISSESFLINTSRCKEWEEESTVDLVRIRALVSEIDNPPFDCDQDRGDHHHGVSRYLSLAMLLYEEAGKRGSSEGWYNLGHLLWTGFSPYRSTLDEPIEMETSDDATSFSGKTQHPTTNAVLEANKSRAMKAFLKAIELGDVDALYFVAVQYLSYDDESKEELGEGNTSSSSSDLDFHQRNHDKNNNSVAISSPAVQLQQGYQFLCQAAEQHQHGPALHHLALLRKYGSPSILSQLPLASGASPCTDEEFRQYLSRAASVGHPESLFLQGHCYYQGTDGYGPKPNHKKALENFLAAAEQGHVDAMVSAGAMLHQGANGGFVGIERNQQRAFELYQRAGELGSVEGWRNVVACYASGEGVPRCLDTARYIAKTMLKDNE